MAPTFNNTDTNANTSTLGREQGSLPPERDPNNPQYLNSPTKSWEFRDGQWVHVPSGYKSWDAKQPGGGGTLGYWLEGLFGGRRDLMGKDTPAEAMRKQQEAAAAAAQAQQDNISARMQKFIDSMLGPMDPNDPVYKGLLQAGTDAAQKWSGQAGLAGRSGLGATNAAAVAQQNVLPWMQARQQAGQTMLGQLSNRDISLANLSQGQQRIDQGLAESQYNAQRNTMGTIGGIAGGVLGSIYGGPGGGAVGSQLGSAALGAIGGGQAPATAPTYKPGGGYKPSGGGSGTGY